MRNCCVVYTLIFFLFFALHNFSVEGSILPARQQRNKETHRTGVCQPSCTDLIRVRGASLEVALH